MTEQQMRWVGFAIFLTLLLSVSFGVSYYLYRRSIYLLDIDSKSLMWALRIVFLVLAIAYPSARIMVRQHINIAGVAWFWIGSMWLGVAFYWFFYNLTAHVGITVTRLSPSLRQTLDFHGGTLGMAVFIAVVAATLVTCSYAMCRAYASATVTEFDLPIKDLPSELEGFTVVQISDAHLGIVVGASHTRKIVEQVNSLKPDLLVVTGDLIDEDPEGLDRIFTELKKLKARYGVFAVTGNHEFYNHPNRIMRLAGEVGIRYLKNEKVVVADKLLLYGLHDPAARQSGMTGPRFDEVIGPEALEAPAILLYHRPTGLRQAAELGINLMLAGHTHNGQLWPFKYIVRQVIPMTYGKFTYDGCMLFVSRGVGVWGPPMRLGSPPEIVKIHLTARK